MPTICPVCEARGPAPCSGCRAALRPALALSKPPYVDSCAALLDYDGAGRELVARLKYRNARASLAFLAAAMIPLVRDTELDGVTWAPTTDQRRRERGFDQAQLLARAVARRLRLPCRRLLARRPGPVQTGRSLAQRRVGPAFGARRRSPPRVLLIDDVVTSGATVAAAARVLREAGAEEVHVLAAARTAPRPR